MKRFHVALGVSDVPESIRDYSHRLGLEPELVIPGDYALWRTESLNFSIRRYPEQPGTVRHLGWEDDDLCGFTVQKDVNGLAWEYFNARAQTDEIRQLWPGTSRAIEPLR